VDRRLGELRDPGGLNMALPDKWRKIARR
jgi:hypothetical protein